jgi:hypothetical protein
LRSPAIVIIGVGVRFGSIAPEGGHLDDLAAKHHVDNPESPSDQPGVPEQVVHFLGGGIGRDVEILGLAAQQDVSYAAAHEVCFIARFVQAMQNFLGGFADNRAGDVVLVPGDFPSLVGAGFLFSVAGHEGTEFVDKSFRH